MEEEEEEEEERRWCLLAKKMPFLLDRILRAEEGRLKVPRFLEEVKVVSCGRVPSNDNNRVYPRLSYSKPEHIILNFNYPTKEGEK